MPTEAMEPHVLIGISWSWLQRGHEHPRNVNAARGQHYWAQ
ncbi:hypothetical protein ACNSTU_15830 [Aquisalimonas sp. APHAB1-3]